MSDSTDKTRRVRERALDYIRNNPDGVRTSEIEKIVGQSNGGLVYQIERLQSQGLVWRDKVGKDGRWLPVASGEQPPAPPLSGAKTRQFNKILALVDRQGHVTLKDATEELGYSATATAGRRVHEMVEYGLLVPGDVPEGIRANKAWTRPSGENATAPDVVPAPRASLMPLQAHAGDGPHTHPEVLAARRITATYAMTKALEEVTDPASETSLHEVSHRLTRALDGPLRAHIAADLEGWARQEEKAGNPDKAQVMCEVSVWITHTVTTLQEDL